MIFERFKQCVTFLIANTASNITQQKTVLSDQKLSLNAEQAKLSKELRQVGLNAARDNAGIQARIDEIVTGELAEYRALLKIQQQALDSTAKLITIGRIKDRNSEIDRSNKMIAANHLQLELKAKVVANLIKEIEAVDSETAFMDDCLLANTFLTNQGVSIESMADYEIERYYRLFRTNSVN